MYGVWSLSTWPSDGTGHRATGALPPCYRITVRTVSRAPGTYHVACPLWTPDHGMIHVPVRSQGGRDEPSTTPHQGGTMYVLAGIVAPYLIILSLVLVALAMGVRVPA